MNKALLLGHLGKDPEMKYLQSGTAIANISLATTTKIKDVKKTQWHRCTAFGKVAETLGKYCYKGDMICVEGRIEYGQYEKDGITRYTTDIIIDRFYFAGSPKDRGEREATATHESPGAPTPDDDIPF